MELIRISTAGSVDDGKSTLIGRLLYDNAALTIEQEELIRKKTEEKGLKEQEALAKGMEEKSSQFKEQGSEIYL